MSDIDPHISAIIPTIDRPQDLVDAVISVLNQKYLPSELIIVDQSFSKASYNSVKDVYDAFELSKQLSDDIDYRIDRYAKCICRSTHNFVTWLKDDYKTKLRLYLKDNFDRDFEIIHGRPPEE